jgi:hypothetical protein
MADATDLKSVDPKGSCGFESRHRHQVPERIRGQFQVFKITNNSKIQDIRQTVSNVFSAVFTRPSRQTRQNRLLGALRGIVNMWNPPFTESLFHAP